MRAALGRRCASWATSSSWAAHRTRRCARARKARQRALSLFLRHARRGGADRADAARYRAGLRRRHRGRRRARRAATRSDQRAPSISVKLSALHPRYEFAQRERVLAELVPALSSSLALGARSAASASRIDAEEADRLELSLDVIDAAASASDAHARLRGLRPRGAGLPEARAATSRVAGRRWRARPAGASRCAWSRARTGTARSSARRSGASPATRCSRARPTPTCPTSPARALLEARRRAHLPAVRHPQRAHRRARRAQCSAADASRVRVPAPARHGRGAVRRGGARTLGAAMPCRVYAPVGAHEDLLPYLVRRLLENGANTSFVNRIVDAQPAGRRGRGRPVARGRRAATACRIRAFRCRANLFAPERVNSAGFNFADGQAVDALLRDCARASQQPWSAAPVVAGQARAAPSARCAIPPTHRRAHRHRRRLPTPHRSTRAIAAARGRPAGLGCAPAASDAPPILERAAQSVRGAHGRVRRALRARGRQDPARCHRRSARGGGFPALLRGARARATSRTKRTLPGPTGERNLLRLRGKRSVRLHQSVEFPAGDLHGPGGRGAGGRQRRRGQAGRTDATDRGLCDAGCCCRQAFRPRHCTSCPATAARWARR